MITITQEQRDLYQKEGYMILPAVIPPAMLEMLRGEIDTLWKKLAP